MSVTDAGDGTATLAGTPLNADVGGNSVVLQVADTAGATDTQSFTVTVANTNDDPTVATAISDASTDEDAAYSLDISSNFADVDAGDTLSYTATGMPTTLTMSTAGVLSGTPVNADVGVHTIVVTATDDATTAGSVTDTFELTVVNTNDPTLGSVTVTGDTYDDAVLTAVTSLLTDDDGMGTFAYQWANQDGDVTGATSSTYTIPSCESTAVCSVLGNTYTVTVVHTDATGDSSTTIPASDATSAVTLNPSGDLDGDGLINSVDTDDDGDGWIDTADTFPTDSDEWVDTDSDGIGNNEDTDDDGDGVADTDDDFPLDSTEQYDADGDGWGHNADSDDDGDGIEDTVDTDDDGDGDPDATDQFPNNPSEWDDTDSDGTGDNADTDDDGDGVDDVSDAFPLDSTETLDTDGDGTGNNADTDDDGDGFSDADEDTNCGEGNDPLDASDMPTDTDGDLSCNALDDDDDGDGVVDTSDAFPLDPSETTDYDNDGTGDNADTDDDNDGYADDVDAFDNDVDAWTDTDGDGLADEIGRAHV